MNSENTLNSKPSFWLKTSCSFLWEKTNSVFLLKNISNSFLTNPELVEVARSNTLCEQVAQAVHYVNKDKKKKWITLKLSESKLILALLKVK